MNSKGYFVDLNLICTSRHWHYYPRPKISLPLASRMASFSGFLRRSPRPPSSLPPGLGTPSKCWCLVGLHPVLSFLIPHGFSVWSHPLLWFPIRITSPKLLPKPQRIIFQSSWTSITRSVLKNAHSTPLKLSVLKSKSPPFPSTSFLYRCWLFTSSLTRHTHRAPTPAEPTFHVPALFVTGSSRSLPPHVVLPCS